MFHLFPVRNEAHTPLASRILICTRPDVFRTRCMYMHLRIGLSQTTISGETICVSRRMVFDLRFSNHRLVAASCIHIHIHIRMYKNLVAPYVSISIETCCVSTDSLLPPHSFQETQKAGRSPHISVEPCPFG